MPIFEYGSVELDYLRKNDKKLKAAIDGIGLIEREVIPDLFTALVNSIVSQQISAKAAATIWNRLLIKLGEINPVNISTASVTDIQSCGITNRKAAYIKGIGDAVVHGSLDLSSFHQLSDEEVIKQLSALNGVGKWTAEMLLIFSMQRPDVVSWGDLAIQRGMMKLYGLNSLSKEQFDMYRKRYSPFGSIASLYLWELSRI